MDTSIKIIGTIHSPLKKLEDCPRQENEQAPPATIIIDPTFIQGIKDIKAGSEILLFTWLHKADRKVIQTKPRNDPDAPDTGVFSTRSPDRPNPIGMHKVKVMAVENNIIKLVALEALDQTPVIDIKPIW
ncbi:MAG TPA: tRNA (N6-threonylcarbamoyladenosine(37)-N6)-methyltransferase TrmO [Chitinophagaceae bacterium]|jgi:tRNA-Thr(GGU) m(6)t(6)A37 methyltransferase TsaA|nr:tRNA (N6-threonylcarbamoyladenosine(37)-N6)-methyltransferase TrmO [Chitinophagaceae bacterium]